MAERPYRISVVELTRIVRFHLEGSSPPLGCNGYAGRPALSGIAPMVEVHITLRGDPDPKTHYVLDIKKFDRWANEHIFPAITVLPQSSNLDQILRRVFQATDDFPHELISIKLQLSPYASLSLEHTMPNEPPKLTFSQTYDFAARITCGPTTLMRRRIGRSTENVRVSMATITKLKWLSNPNPAIPSLRANSTGW